MKPVLWESTGGPVPGLLTTRGIVGVPDARSIEQLIDSFAERRAELERLADEGAAIPLESAHLLPPLPRPGKILCSTASYAPVTFFGGDRAR